MDTKVFTYHKRSQKNIGLLFLGVGFLGMLLILYVWLWADSVSLRILVGGVFLAFLGIIGFLKLVLIPKKENEMAIVISDSGIKSTTTPIAKAAEWIEWTDVEYVQVYNHILEIKIKQPEKYAIRMKNFFVRDTFLKGLNGIVKVSLVETNATRNELLKILELYLEQKNIRIN